MAYHLALGESVPENIKRIAREEIQDAVEHLRAKGSANRDEAIHEARKNVKKVRALLRLVEREMGDAYLPQNNRLREVGQKLSILRDAGALIPAFDEVKDRYRKRLSRRGVNSIRRALMARKDQAEQKIDLRQLMAKLAAKMNDCAKGIKVWPLQTDNFSAIAPGLEKTFRRAKKALLRAKVKGRPENFHEWRKRVKDHWYHIRLLENLWTDLMKGQEKSLKELETWLGEDHNLVLLREVIAAAPDTYGGRKDIDLLLSKIDKYQKELRDNALSLGMRVYEDKPRRFTRQIGNLWNVWQEQPPDIRPRKKKG